MARVPRSLPGCSRGNTKPGDRFSAGDVRSRWDPAHTRRQIAEAQKILHAEVPPGIPPARWALAWCLKNPAVSCVIPGCKSPGQVEENARAAELLPAI